MRSQSKQNNIQVQLNKNSIKQKSINNQMVSLSTINPEKSKLIPIHSKQLSQKTDLPIRGSFVKQFPRRPPIHRKQKETSYRKNYRTWGDSTPWEGNAWKAAEPEKAVTSCGGGLKNRRPLWRILCIAMENQRLACSCEENGCYEWE